jgi:uncharacterized protein (DUF2147 family)
MKRSGCLVLLMMLSSSAHADTFSFDVAGYRIRLEAPRHCGSPSCISVSFPPIHATHRRREWKEDVVAPEIPKPAKPAPPLASLPPVAPSSETASQSANQSASQPVNQPANQPAGEAAAEPPAAAPATAAPTETPPDGAAKQATAPAKPSPPTPPETEPATNQPAKPQVTSPPPTQAVQTSQTVSPVSAPAQVEPAQVAPEQVAKASRQSDSPAPLGDWRTDGDKGLVRIQPCGNALCGYVLDASSDTIGEAVLVNMKSETASLWSGNIYSRASGVTYYGTIAAMKGANSLWVEACALGRFFCSGKVWRRVAQPQPQMLSSKTTQVSRF